MKLSGTRRIQTFRKASGAAIVVVLASTVAITTVWFLCARGAPLGTASTSSTRNGSTENARGAPMITVRAGQTKMPVRAGRFVPFVCEDAFEGLTFFDPLWAGTLPDGTRRFVVVERRGTIQVVQRRGETYTKSPFVDLTDRVRTTPEMAEEGLLGLAFHPDYATGGAAHRGEAFIYYIANTLQGPVNRLSRIRAVDALDRLDPDSEEILIEQVERDQAHNGGGLAFGPDGYLYLSIGDDARPNPNPNAQAIDRDLFSGILRLDVDRRGGSQSHSPPRQPQHGRTAGYFVPADNPFVGHPGVLEEFYALGLRNPWRFSFDRATGRLYVSDAGSRRREEINQIEAGANCGWDYMEGTLNLREIGLDAPPTPKRLIGRQTLPLFEYSRDAAHRCVIGGYVYRGRQFPELEGCYVYADQSGRVYALELTEDGRRVRSNRLLALLDERGIGISSFGEDADGELYLASIGKLASETGRVYRLRRRAPEEVDSVPKEFSETGVDWDAANADAVNANLTPYDVNVPSWSDGAEQRRWIHVPDGRRVGVGEGGAFSYPPGTVFVQHLDLVIDRRPPQRRRKLETRILVCDDRGGVYCAGYRWRDERHARLVTFVEAEDIDVIHADGTSVRQTWVYPGRFECALCHNANSGNVLGFSLKQLHSPATRVTGKPSSQLVELEAAGVLAPQAVAVPPETIPRIVRLDEASAAAGLRVRSYLEVNCSPCHNPRTRFAAFDAQIERDPNEQGIVNGMSHYHQDMGPFVRIVRPGDAGLSMLFNRVVTSDPCMRMPPLDTTVVDARAVDAIAEWIHELGREAKTAERTSANLGD